MKKLENKVALITGGNLGIGLATEKLFKDQGAKVIITADQIKASLPIKRFGSSDEMAK